LGKRFAYSSDFTEPLTVQMTDEEIQSAVLATIIAFVSIETKKGKRISSFPCFSYSVLFLIILYSKYETY
jgi:hypothetical protein